MIFLSAIFLAFILVPCFADEEKAEERRGYLPHSSPPYPPSEDEF